MWDRMSSMANGIHGLCQQTITEHQWSNVRRPRVLGEGMTDPILGDQEVCEITGTGFQWSGLREIFRVR